MLPGEDLPPQPVPSREKKQRRAYRSETMTTRKTYPIIGNCNYESREDADGQAIHAARKAVEAGLTDDAELLAALDTLEDTLGQYADNDCEPAVRICWVSEDQVVHCWTEGICDAVEERRQERW